MESNTSIEFICLGSSSAGNAYIFKKNDECVLVECGFEYKKLVSKLMDNNISVSQIKSVIVTHFHGDHSKALSKFISMGVKCYSPFIENENNCHNIADNSRYDLASWLSVIAFHVNHDCDAFGYAFLDKENKESILFINDTAYFDMPLSKVRFDYIFIECNHIRSQLEAIKHKAIAEGRTGEAVKFERQSKFHLSLASLKKILNKMDLSNTKYIFLMHLSKQCCNPIVCKTEISSVYKVKTFYCGTNGGFN